MLPLKNRYCGICTTDLKRHCLPFPLPQIIGHEIVGWRVKGDNYDELHKLHARPRII
jgi:D-arabinose 1-dehydrogenase-like Zn-dependent alcohol dehydrogenase